VQTALFNLLVRNNKESFEVVFLHRRHHVVHHPEAGVSVSFDNEQRLEILGPGPVDGF
jgi:hypothetical protein